MTFTVWIYVVLAASIAAILIGFFLIKKWKDDPEWCEIHPDAIQVVRVGDHIKNRRGHEGKVMDITTTDGFTYLDVEYNFGDGYVVRAYEVDYDCRLIRKRGKNE